MPTYTITATVDGTRLDSVKKVLAESFKRAGQEPLIATVEKKTSPESRAERLAEAEGMADDARQIVEELKDEMDQWYDSIPDNFKDGDKANAVESARDMLEELQSCLEQLDFTSVEFPGMF